MDQVWNQRAQQRVQQRGMNASVRGWTKYRTRRRSSFTKKEVPDNRNSCRTPLF